MWPPPASHATCHHPPGRASTRVMLIVTLVWYQPPSSTTTPPSPKPILIHIKLVPPLLSKHFDHHHPLLSGPLPLFPSSSLDSFMDSADSSSGSPHPQLPPGFRFHPTDEELVVHYLKRKLASAPLPVTIIADVDLYKFDPWELPSINSHSIIIVIFS